MFEEEARPPGSWPAFPAPSSTWREGIDARTYIATAALQGLLARDSLSVSPWTAEPDAAARYARRAVEMADALVAALARREVPS